MVLYRKLIRDLLARKGALLALVLMVAIGVACYVGLAGVFRDLDSARSRYYNTNRLADFSVDVKRLPTTLLPQISQSQNIQRLEGRISFPARIDLPKVALPISGTAISLPLERQVIINDVLLCRGSWFRGGDDHEVILNDAFATANQLKPGDRIQVLLLDREYDLLIVGTAMSPEFVYLVPPGAGLAPDPARFGVLYLRKDFLQRACDLQGACNQLVGLAHNNSKPELVRTLEILERQLEPYGVTNTTPVQEQTSVQFLADELMGLKSTAMVMPTIFLVVAALVLNILVGRMVSQQRSTIGTLRALGYSTRSIFTHYLGYGAIVGALGGTSGCLFGVWMQSFYVGVYRQFFDIPQINLHLYGDILWQGWLISVICSMLGTVKGIRYAVRLEPSEAMRPPAPEIGGKVLPERVTIFWNHLSFNWKMVFRAIFRNPFRSGVVILASVISTALIVSAFGMLDSLDYLMNYQFIRISHEDNTISLREPVDMGSISEARLLPGVKAVEPQLSVPCELRLGPLRRRVGVIGLPSNNRLFTPLDKLNQPVVIPQRGLVLSKKLAELLNARQGDVLQLRALIGTRKECWAPVMAVVDTYLGLSAYAHLEYLSHLIGETAVVNNLLTVNQPKQSDDRFLHEVHQRPAVIGVSRRARSMEALHESFGQTMGVFIGVLVLFAGLIAFGSVFNTALVSLSERQREVASLRVLGYLPGQISRIFSGESLLLNVVGIGLGLWAGHGMVELISQAYNTDVYRFPAIIHPLRYPLSVVLMLFFVGLAQWIIYRMIRRLDWLEQLKVKE